MSWGDATRGIRYIVVADEGLDDVVVGSFESIQEAREAVESYNSTRRDPFCWIEQSDVDDAGGADSSFSRL